MIGAGVAQVVWAPAGHSDAARLIPSHMNVLAVVLVIGWVAVVAAVVVSGYLHRRRARVMVEDFQRARQALARRSTMAAIRDQDGRRRRVG